MNIVEGIFRLIHILGAVVWVGFGLYNYLINTRIAENMPAATLNYHLGIAKHSKYGQIMAIAAVSTTLAGLFLWGIARPFTRETDLALIILGIGSVAGLAAMGHGIGIGKKSDALQKALIAAESNGQVDTSKNPEIGGMIAALNKSANISLGMMAVALICMSVYSVF